MFSHELKTPISSLKLALNLIKKNRIPRNEKEELIELMDQEIQRMMDFISDTLDWRLLKERGDLMKFQWEIWGDIIERSVKSFELPVREKSIQWKIENLNGNMEVFMDSLWIKQVIDNLISNALKNSPNNSMIFISSHIMSSGALRISVRDEGQGVSLEEKKRLFEAFHKRRTKDQGILKNTGLGLTIVRTVIERHQGIIGLSSTDQGSEFYFELPKIRQVKQTA